MGELILTIILFTSMIESRMCLIRESGSDYKHKIIIMNQRRVYNNRRKYYLRSIFGKISQVRYHDPGKNVTGSTQNGFWEKLAESN